MFISYIWFCSCIERKEYRDFSKVVVQHIIMTSARDMTARYVTVDQSQLLAIKGIDQPAMSKGYLISQRSFRFMVNTG